MFSPTESFHTEQRCFFTVYFLASCDLGGLIVCDNYHVGIRPGLTYITANTALHSHWQPEREAWAKIIKAIFSLKNVIIWNIMMAVNSWLITIKRRIKLPLVPPGGTAAISALEHYCTNQGWLACCLTLPSSHLTSPHLTSPSHLKHSSRPCQGTNRNSITTKSDLIYNINSPFFHNSQNLFFSSL